MDSNPSDDSILDLVRDLPGIHVAGSSRGSKRHLLELPAPGPAPVAATETISLSRRGFLQSIAAATGAAVWALWTPVPLRANPFLWVAGTVLASAIGWVVGKVLDYATSKRAVTRPTSFPRTETELGLKQVENPAPTRDRFHNTYALNHVITNTNCYIPPVYLPGYGYRFGVSEFLLMTDMNYVEMRQVQAEEQFHGGVLLPGGLRRPYNRLFDGRPLQDTARRYDTEVRDDQIYYVTTLTDPQGKPHAGFAVNRGDKAQFLLS